MPIAVPLKIPTQHQIKKALRCVVEVVDEGWHVWDPKDVTEHIVKMPLECDCIGYTVRSFCSHVTAVVIHKNFKECKNAHDVIAEIWGVCVLT